MNPPSSSPYDEVLYPSHSFSQTHPDRLATLATLFGMSPAPVERCRVLELGCGDGSNVIPMAFGLPDSTFVGVDLAARPIAIGQEMVGALGLKNIELRCENVLDFAPAAGRFDFIIAHGLYAWVPAVVQEKVMAICRAHLSPQGVAFISYNAYPGCHVRDMMREMMLFHVRNLSDPHPRLEQAVALVKFLAHSQAKSDIHRQFFQKELERIEENSAASLYHDDLAECNAPAYFHEFARHAARHGLQYLGEADYYEMQDHVYTPQVVQTLKQLSGDRIMREQYLDFLKCRRFRQTLLCHGEAALETNPRPGAVRNFSISSSAQPVSIEPDFRSGRSERFVGKNDAAMETDYPLAKAAMIVLRTCWPQRIAFGDLIVRSRAMLDHRGDGEAGDPEEEARALSTILLQTYASGLVQFHVHSPSIAATPGARPTASALVRLQIERGHHLTNLLHDTVAVEDDLAAHLVRLLDGSRGRAELLAEMSARIGSQDTAAIMESLENNLQKLARIGLLVA